MRSPKRSSARWDRELLRSEEERAARQGTSEPRRVGLPDARYGGIVCKLTKEDNAKARACFRAGDRAGSEFAGAFAGLALTHYGDSHHPVDRLASSSPLDEQFRAARRSCVRARQHSAIGHSGSLGPSVSVASANEAIAAARTRDSSWTRAMPVAHLVTRLRPCA